MSVSLNIKTLRENAGLTQTDLALRLGYDKRDRVTNWEREHSKPSYEDAVKLSDYFSVDINAFITGEPVKVMEREEKILSLVEDYFTDKNLSARDRAKMFQTISNLFLSSTYK